MRLDPATVPRLLNAVHDVFGENAQVWLFGSRADDTRSGGDIDIYVETDLVQGLVARRLELLGRLFTLYGEQKIDLLVRPRSRPPQPIHEIARREGVLLAERS
jgi:predicted nucleotidyltransferase